MMNTLPTRNVVRLKALQRASRRLEVVRVSDTPARYLVRSGSRPEQRYEVELDPTTLSGRCSCPWGQYGGVNCKHILAVLRERYANQGALSFWPSAEAARRQHRPIIAGEHLLATLRRREARAAR